MKVLIIDDDSAVRDGVQKILRGAATEVSVADGARDGVEMAKDGDFDFVLLAYKMAAEDGVWFMENSRISRDTKVLIMTEYVNREAINQMFTLGAVGYLIKPFDAPELLRHIDFHSTR